MPTNPAVAKAIDAIRKEIATVGKRKSRDHGFDEPDAGRARFPQRIEMVKVTLKNYQDSEDYGKIVAAAGRVLARRRYISPIEVFVELEFLAAGT